MWSHHCPSPQPGMPVSSYFSFRAELRYQLLCKARSLPTSCLLRGLLGKLLAGSGLLSVCTSPLAVRFHLLLLLISTLQLIMIFTFIYNLGLGAIILASVY